MNHLIEGEPWGLRNGPPEYSHPMNKLEEPQLGSDAEKVPPKGSGVELGRMDVSCGIDKTADLTEVLKARRVTFGDVMFEKMESPSPTSRKSILKMREKNTESNDDSCESHNGTESALKSDVSAHNDNLSQKKQYNLRRRFQTMNTCVSHNDSQPVSTTSRCSARLQKLNETPIYVESDEDADEPLACSMAKRKLFTQGDMVTNGTSDTMVEETSLVVSADERIPISEPPCGYVRNKKRPPCLLGDCYVMLREMDTTCFEGGTVKLSEETTKRLDDTPLSRKRPREEMEVCGDKDGSKKHSPKISYLICYTPLTAKIQRLMESVAEGEVAVAKLKEM